MNVIYSLSRSKDVSSEHLQDLKILELETVMNGINSASLSGVS